MNDETHDSGSADQAPGSVLRPFEAPAPPPLPPVEPSRVVPDLPSEDAVLPDRESMPTTAEAERQAEVDESDVGVLLDAAPTGTTTLPRTPSLVGAGMLLAVIALATALWQAGGDEGDAMSDATPVARDVGDDPAEMVSEDAEDAEDIEDAGDGEENDGAAPVDTGAIEDLAAARAQIAGLESVVESLQDRAPPALDGSTMRRIVVGADAKFVSALRYSVAVVGAFGGVSLIDPETNRVVANSNVADTAMRAMRTPTSVWLTDSSAQQLIRFDPLTSTVAAVFPFPAPDGIDKDGDTLVVASFEGEFVARVDPNNGNIIQQVDVGGTPTEVISHPDHGLWAAVFDTGELVEIDRDSFEVLQRVVVGQRPVGISAAASHLWVTNHAEGTIAKVDPGTGEVALTVPVGNGPTGLVVANGSVWVTVTDDGNLLQVDPTNGELLSSTPLGGASAGGGPTGIDALEGTLWVAIQGEQSVVRIDLAA